MPSLSCYRLRSEIEGVTVQGFDDYLGADVGNVKIHGPVAGEGFAAKLFVTSVPPRQPTWISFVDQGFGPADQWPTISSAGALLLVRLDEPDLGYFGFTFGTMGRFLLRSDAHRPAFGLRTALNLMYPSGDATNPSRLRSVDSHRHDRSTVRARRQTSIASTFEVFDVDRMREFLRTAVGKPADQARWGLRVGGSDALNVSPELHFSEIGQLCRDIHAASERTDYRERFAWVDDMQPVTEPQVVAHLHEAVLSMLRDGRLDDLDLGPPSIVDWDRIHGFRLPTDRGKFSRPEMRLEDLVRGLDAKGYLADLDVPFLRRNSIVAVDGDGTSAERWSIWRCLVGTFVMDGTTYVLDNGDFWVISPDFQARLDSDIDGIPEVTWLPVAGRTMQEDDYNRHAASVTAGCLLLDKRLVTARTKTTPVEICDLLTADRKLVHVKRHLGSRDLSHLFSQGAVSAELLQSDADFRNEAQRVVREVAEGDPHAFFPTSGIDTREFGVVYAIVADWKSRPYSQALPFFSKVNLRRAVTDIRNRGFDVACARVQVTP